VGTAAKNQSVAAGNRVIRESKRDIGRTDATWPIDGTVYTPEMVGSLVLKKLKNDAEKKLGEPIVNAVITVPAYFDDSQRAATEAAGEMAGLNVIGILNEPVAAALAYGLDKKREDGVVVVYDLGGGTFDVSVMKVEGGKITMVATDGNVELGGKDWDERIIKHLAEKFKEQHGVDPREDVDTYQQLKNDAESAKESLSNKEKTRVIVQHQGNKMVYELTRQEFDALTEDLLSQTGVTLREVVEDQSKLTWDQVGQVLLVGGSSKMPQVAKMVHELTGKDVSVGDPQPDLCVAVGAAYYSLVTELKADVATGGGTASKKYMHMPKSELDKIAKTSLTMCTSHSYGVEAYEEKAGGKLEPFNAILIRKNAALPAEHTDTFYLLDEGQSAVEVKVYEGEERDLQFCTAAGTKIIEFAPMAKGSPIDVTMQFTEHGMIRVRAVDKNSKKVLGDMELDRSQGMSEAEKKKATILLSQKAVE
jgi:molecular chaperone DnaK